MSILDRIEIVCGDVRDVACDLLVLKYADGLYGADLAVAERLDVNIHVVKGQTKLLPRRDHDLGAAQVLYRGVGDLFKFRYSEIATFAYANLVDAQDILSSGGTLATTIHGPGYGLDEREAFASQLKGFSLLADYATDHVGKLLIVEKDPDRAARLVNNLIPQYDFPSNDGTEETVRKGIAALRLETSLQKLRQHSHDAARMARGAVSIQDRKLVWSAGTTQSSPKQKPTAPPEKPKLFAAMPFADKYLDEYHIAFVESAHAHGFLCERLDLENYVGDIIDEIFKRIRDSAGVVALLNDNNPNVFLELGHALALEKPVILVAHEDLEVAFDLRSQNRKTYKSIYKLRQEMTALIGDLKSDGTL